LLKYRPSGRGSFGSFDPELDIIYSINNLKTPKKSFSGKNYQPIFVTDCKFTAVNFKKYLIFFPGQRVLCL
jgi:hypothetical protein